MKELEKMTKEEKEIFILLKQKILEAHQEGIKRREANNSNNSSKGKSWWLGL